MQRMASIRFQDGTGREFALQYEYERLSHVGDPADAAGRQARGHLRPDFLFGIPGDLAGDDTDGAAAGGVSLSAAGVGHADCAFEPGVDGAGADDDLVSDAAGDDASRSAGGDAVSVGDDFGE